MAIAAGTVTEDLRPERSARFDGNWVARSSALLLGGTVVVAALALAQGIAVSRLLGPSGKGEAFLAILIATSVAQLLECSLGAGMQYHLARGRLSLRHALRYALAFAFLASLVAAAVGAVLIVVDGSARRSLGVIGILATALIVPAEALNLSLTPLFVATDRVGASAAVDTFRTGAMLVLVLVLVGVLDRSTSMALTATAIAYLAAAVIAVWILVTSQAAKHVSSENEDVAFREVIGFGARQHVGSVLARVTKRADNYILLAMAGPKAVGIYSVASGLAELPMMLPRSMQSAATTFTASREAGGAAQGAARLSRVTMFVMITGSALYGLVGWLLVPVIYGQEFSDARLPFAILLVSTAALGTYVVIGGFLSGVGHPHLLTLVLLLPVLANVLLSIMLIPKFGMPGNAAASAITSGAVLLSGLIAFRRVSGVEISAVVVPRRDDLRRVLDLWPRSGQRGRSQRSAS